MNSLFSEVRRANDNSLNISGQTAHSINEDIKRRRSEFSALLNKGKMIVAFIDKLFEVYLNLGNSGVNIDNYSWLPDQNIKRFTNRLVDGVGKGLNLSRKEHLFLPYFLAFQNELTFNSYVDIPVSSFDLGEAFIINSADQVVGFSTRISNGIVVFLPRFKFNENNNKKFIGVLLGIAKKYFGSEHLSQLPDWVNDFSIPGVAVFDKKVKEIDNKISELELQKIEIVQERNNLNNFNFLLYEQGHPLERKVLDTLKLIGFKAETVAGENTDFDVILESEEFRAIAEIEGKDNSAIHKDKIDQLLSAINQDAEGKDTFAKGVLIGNHYRLKPIEEREQPFTDTVIKLAKQYNYALITTVDLYNVAIYFLEHPEDENTKRACRKAILDSKGSIVEFPIPKT